MEIAKAIAGNVGIALLLSAVFVGWWCLETKRQQDKIKRMCSRFHWMEKDNDTDHT